MKVAILFTILCIVACSRAESVCQCATYFTSDVKESSKVYAIPDSEIPDCSTCQQKCEEVISQATNGGILSHVTSNGATVGQIACKTYAKDIKNGQLAAYSKCGSAEWVKGQNAKGVLCCKSGAEC